MRALEEKIVNLRKQIRSTNSIGERISLVSQLESAYQTYGMLVFNEKFDKEISLESKTCS